MKYFTNLKSLVILKPKDNSLKMSTLQFQYYFKKKTSWCVYSTAVNDTHFHSDIKSSTNLYPAPQVLQSYLKFIRNAQMVSIKVSLIVKAYVENKSK